MQMYEDEVQALARQQVHEDIERAKAIAPGAGGRA